jgi:hypothetical protein
MLTAAKKNRATIMSEKSPTFPSRKPLCTMKKSLKILLFILLAACSSRNTTEPLEEPIVLEAENEYVDLSPVDSNNTGYIYDIHGFKFQLSLGWKTQELKGSDFAVSSLLSPLGSRFSCYFGWHPSYPWPINDYTKTRPFPVFDYLEIRNPDNSVNDFSMKLEAPIEDGLNADSSIRYRNDSVFFELYNLKDREIWVRKPFPNASGPIDIGVIFRADSIKTKLHFFGEVSSHLEAQKLIEIAKELKRCA